MNENIFDKLDFGPLKSLLDDDDITDISYDNNGQIWIRSLTQGSIRVEVNGATPEFVEKLAFQCSNVMGTTFNNAKPFLDAESSELRLNFVHPSIATNGIAMVIRKTPAKIRLEKEKLLKDDYFTQDIHDILIKCVEGHCNIIVSGETGSGKTEFVKYLASHTKTNEKMLFRCNICNNEWKTIPDVVLGGHTCPKCSHKQSGDIWRKSKNTFIKEISNINSNIEITGEYINDSTQIECLCKICNTKWKATPNNLLHNSGCPKCKSSKGENKIDKYLSSNNVCFNRQHKFKDCKNIRTLPFDFYLPDYNTCIEYDGELHYKAVDYYGGEDALRNTKYRDEIKTQYCKENNIKLIRIPYWEFDNIEEILNRELEVG